MSNFDVALHQRVRDLLSNERTRHQAGEILRREEVNMVDLLEVVARQNQLGPEGKNTILVGAGITNLKALQKIMDRAPNDSAAWNAKHAPFLFGYLPYPTRDEVKDTEPNIPTE